MHARLHPSHASRSATKAAPLPEDGVETYNRRRGPRLSQQHVRDLAQSLRSL